MPWTKKDVDKHIGGLTDHQKSVWVAVANSALAKCEKEGGTSCDAKAIRQANAQAKKAEALQQTLVNFEEIGRAISATNATKLRDVVKSARAILDQLTSLVADDADEETVSEALRQINLRNGIHIHEALKRWELVNIGEAAKILAQIDSYDSVRSAVSMALRKRAISDMLAAKVNSGEQLGYSDYYDYEYGSMPYIRDMYPNDGIVVYCMAGELYQCDYTVNGDGTVDLGEPTQVEVSYVPVSDGDITESKNKKVELSNEIISLVEKAVKDDNTVQIKLISPGWGSSGYYSAEMLKRDGPKAFPKGLHMYINHPTATQEIDRPERDLNDFAGALISDAEWLEKGPTGPGLYATAAVVSRYKDFIDEAQPYIGTSIRASGRGKEGAAEGKTGVIVDSLDEGFSVDYVTYPGRGGEVLPLLEAARKLPIKELQAKETKMPEISEEQLKQFTEAVNSSKALTTQLEAQNTEIARMREGLVIRDARDVVVGELAKADLLETTRERLLKSCMRALPMKEGVLDTDTLRANVKEAITEELTYIEAVTGTTTKGKVVGIGNVETKQYTDEEIEKQLSESFTIMGWSEKASQIAAKGR